MASSVSIKARALNNITVAFIRMVMGFPALVAEIKFTVTTAYRSRP